MRGQVLEQSNWGRDEKGGSEREQREKGSRRLKEEVFRHHSIHGDRTLFEVVEFVRTFFNRTVLVDFEYSQFGLLVLETTDDREM